MSQLNYLAMRKFIKLRHKTLIFAQNYRILAKSKIIKILLYYFFARCGKAKAKLKKRKSHFAEFYSSIRKKIKFYFFMFTRSLRVLCATPPLSRVLKKLKSL